MERAGKGPDVILNGSLSVTDDIEDICDLFGLRFEETRICSIDWPALFYRRGNRKYQPAWTRECSRYIPGYAKIRLGVCACNPSFQKHKKGCWGAEYRSSKTSMKSAGFTQKQNRFHFFWGGGFTFWVLVSKCGKLVSTGPGYVSKTSKSAIRLMRSWPNRQGRFSFLLSSDCHFLHNNHGGFPIFPYTIWQG